MMIAYLDSSFSTSIIAWKLVALTGPWSKLPIGSGSFAPHECLLQKSKFRQVSASNSLIYYEVSLLGRLCSFISRILSGNVRISLAR